MFEDLKAFVLRWAMVPPEPHVPEGSTESVRVFRAGRNYYNLLLVKAALGYVGPLIALLVTSLAAAAPSIPPRVRRVWLGIEVIGWAILLATLPLTLLILRLNYELRWYIATDRSLRIRSGIVFMKEMTMTFANIQDIRVTANPLERLLGLANVEVHSAGGGMTAHGGTSGHVGKFEGVDNASAIRDLMVDRLRAYRDSGLGDHPHSEEPRPAEAIDEARIVLAEVRALGTAMNRS
jgi:uncharacterized membrane protein YdbT with pleckstrin-like domain